MPVNDATWGRIVCRGMVGIRQLACKALVELKMFDARGRLLRRLSLGNLSEGTHHLDWDGRDQHGQSVASGVVLLEVIAGKTRGVTKAVLVR